ncbi:class I SAM-dependent methyltransferase [Neorhizobium lilium]|uniref:Class I SAM-dependent methyltransferase n=1 Tax=Neorhizobium lilium TaxID=2503024 RepID=A0A3S3REC5_9HYPH|nr:cyclopropane-fatty-acyl-phospholipid synthase family protein [Neorhizobium lilium]RWX75435.1 class I SAM-dependent methyltransferase [Neorhizobium lilium]
MSQSDQYSGLGLVASTQPARTSWTARLFRKWLRNVQYGHLRIVLPSGEQIEQAGAWPGPEATIVVKRWRLLRRLLAAGDIGFAEGYIEQDWTTPDLTSLLKFAARNIEALSGAAQGNAVIRLANRLRHHLNANTRRGSRRNIEAHYDLGNEFYAAWLDPSMLYSSALYDEDAPTLEAAQQRKLDRIREKLDLSSGTSVLEIGCGWGALAVDLAGRAGAKVTGITLSPSQLAWAKDLVLRSGLNEHVSLELRDYRDIEGTFDRIVSIEMFEAVGERYWPDYFAALKRSMKAEGRAVLQIISINKQHFDRYRCKADFIQKYIFPGGFLPSDAALKAKVEQSGLRLVEIEHFGKSYALTLAEWRARFNANWDRVAALGFDERFHRLWNYYLAYCEAGFEEGRIDVGFYTIEHASAGRAREDKA